MTSSGADKWEQHARAWIDWARAPNHDSFWRFHKDAFLKLLPPPSPSARVVDVGCGEGRVARVMKEVGWRNIIGVEPSSMLCTAAEEAHPDGRYICASGERIPLDDGCADLVVAFTVLHVV